MDKNLMYVSELARKVDVEPSTIRYWTQLGLLKPVSETESGYKLYDRKQMERAIFIKKAKKLGFRLIEIKIVLDTADRGKPPCKHVINFLEKKLKAVEKRIEFLQSYRKTVKKLLSKWRNVSRCSGKICSIIESIDENF